MGSELDTRRIREEAIRTENKAIGRVSLIARVCAALARRFSGASLSGKTLSRCDQWFRTA